MQDHRDDQNRDDNKYSRRTENRPYHGYSAIPGPSFDAGRYASDRRRDLSRNVYPSENRNRTFGEQRGGARHYGDSSNYNRKQHWGSQGQRPDFDDRNDRSRSDFYEMGGYGDSNYNRSYEQQRSRPGSQDYGLSARNSNRGRGREYEREYSQSHDDGHSYSGPDYGSVPTGGRYDSDRDFTSGGITNMGGDYDREHYRGRQYRDNYDSSGTYIGDYDQNQRIRYGSQEQDHNQYNSGFTFGEGSAGRPDYGDFNSGERYGYYKEGQSSSFGPGNNRGEFDPGRKQESFSNRGYSRAGQWDQPYGQQRNFQNQGPHTGNAEYDRRNRMNQDYGRQRSAHPEEDRGFFEQAGDRLRSWFGGDEDDRRHRR